MAGCKRCALKMKKKRKRKKEKRKDKRRKKWGSKSSFFFRAHVFFICTVVIFQIRRNMKKTVSRLSRSYPLLFAITTLMVSQFGNL